MEEEEKDNKNLFFMNERLAAALSPRSKGRKPLCVAPGVSSIEAEPEQVAAVSRSSADSENLCVTDDSAAARSGSVENGNRLRLLRIDAIDLSPFQTREALSDDDLAALATSISQRGVIQPVIVRCGQEPGRFELVAGERRLRASKLAGLTEIPSLLEELEDRDASEVAIIENAQRENLNPIEEALAFKQLVERFDLTQAEIAGIVGKNRATIANALRLLQLDPLILELIKSGRLSSGHGRALLMVEDLRTRLKLARRSVEQELSVRALENLVTRLSEEVASEEELSEEEEREVAQVERWRTKVSELLGVDAVKLSIDSQGRKRLNLVFDTEASWKRFMSRIRD